MGANDLGITSPTSLRKIINDESADDCLGCKIVGGGAFMGLGAYSYYTGIKNLEKNQRKIIQSGSKYGMGARRLGIRGISIMFMGIGVYRLLN